MFVKLHFYQISKAQCYPIWSKWNVRSLRFGCGVSGRKFPRHSSPQPHPKIRENTRCTHYFTRRVVSVDSSKAMDSNGPPPPKWVLDLATIPTPKPRLPNIPDPPGFSSASSTKVGKPKPFLVRSPLIRNSARQPHLSKPYEKHQLQKKQTP